MKQGRILTLRGSFPPSGSTSLKKKLVLDDGRLQHGLRVLQFTMWATTSTDTAGIDATLSLDSIPSGSPTFDASDNRQIAWVSGGYNQGVLILPYREIIDPDHIVNRDLFITADASPNLIWNYMVKCQVYHLSADEAIISMIKEKSQGSVD